MTRWCLIWRNLWHYRRTDITVLAGAAVGTSVLVGALLVGDSVRYSLRRFAMLRLGQVHLAVMAPDRFFTDSLADRLSAAMDRKVAPVLRLRGVMWSKDGSERANKVQILGIDQCFWRLSPAPSPLTLSAHDGVVLNAHLADKLGMSVDDEVLLRIERPTGLSPDMALGERQSRSVATRLTIRAIVGDESFGRFALSSNQIPPDNAFVSLGRLQELIELPQRVNLLLAGGGSSAEAGQKRLRSVWRLADAELKLRDLPNQGQFELRSRRVFIDRSVPPAIRQAGFHSIGILTYFVNELRKENRATPYSMVAAIDQPNALFQELADNEIIINQWLSDDLDAGPGDVIELKYFVLAKDRLEERQSIFTVRTVVPIEGLAADSGLMPAFPGLHEADSCRDWEPGIPIDLGRIRDQDESYWDRYRGTPKAFITLPAGQQLWGNRFGALTSIRIDPAGATVQQVEQAILDQLDPSRLGIRFTDVRTPALQASENALDFGQLFLGLSVFLVVASVLLTGLLFVLAIEQRATETGTLLALGFEPKGIRWLLLAEGAVLSVVGAVVGSAGGLLYTKLVLYGLSTVWSGAVAGSGLLFHAETWTLMAGGAAGAGAALTAMVWATRAQARQAVTELLSAGGPLELMVKIPVATFTRSRVWIAILALLAAAGVVSLWGAGWLGRGGQAVAMVFFLVGGLLLIAGLAACRMILGYLGRPGMKEKFTIGHLGLGNVARRPGRGLTTILLLACGAFLVVAVGVNRLVPPRDPTDRTSGTGGFVLYGESTLPLIHDLETPRGRDAYGLAEEDLGGVRIVPLRVRDGDDASCLNLNRAQTPTLLGLDPGSLAQRGSFRFLKLIDESYWQEPWQVLQDAEPDDAIVPAVADRNTVSWGLGKSLGDRIRFTDEAGEPFEIEIVAVIDNSILQGDLVISQRAFEQRYPSEIGYRKFLIDAPPASQEHLARLLSRSMEDIGVELSPTLKRLADFNVVENTYHAIFGALGALGLLLGSAGLAMVVLRNLLERRSELALLQAVGFRRLSLHQLTMAEHGLIVLMGLGCGAVAALVAVWPTVRSSGSDVPLGAVAASLIAIAANAAFWIWLATALSLRGRLTDALRGE